MKLRIHDNHIRLRLTRVEIAELAQGHPIQSRVDLLPQRLTYQLVAAADASIPSMHFECGVLSIALPLSSAVRLASTEEVGIESMISAAFEQASPVYLLIEKDFKCLHGEAKDQEGCFTNPLAAIATLP